MTTTTIDKRESLVTGLAALLNHLTANPSAQPPEHIRIRIFGSPAEVKAQVETFLRGAEGLVRKETVSYDDSQLRLIRQFGELEVVMDLNKDALGCRKVTKMVPTEAWECGPILDAIKEKGE